MLFGAIRYVLRCVQDAAICSEVWLDMRCWCEVCRGAVKCCSVSFDMCLGVSKMLLYVLRCG